MGSEKSAAKPLGKRARAQYNAKVAVGESFMVPDVKGREVA